MAGRCPTPGLGEAVGTEQGRLLSDLGELRPKVGSVKGQAVIPTGATLSVLLTLLVVAVEPDLRVLLLIVAVAVTTAEWAVLQRLTGHRLPLAGVLIAPLNLIGVAGALYFPTLSDRAFVSARPDSQDYYQDSGWVFCLAALTVFAGAALASTMRSRARPHQTILSLRHPPAFGAAVAACTATAACLVAGYTWSGLLSRERYLLIAGVGPLAQVGSILVLPAFVLVGFAWSRAVGTARLALTVVASGLVLVVLGTGSRALGLVPVAVAVGLFVARQGQQRRRQTVVLLVGTMVLSAYMLQLPLVLRSASVGGAGIEPYLFYMFANLGRVFAPEVLLSILGNVLYAVPLAALSSSLDLPASWFWTSVSPLPGFLTEWPAIQPYLRINVNTPTNGIGELVAYGLPYFVSYFLVVGAAVTYLQGLVDRLSPARAQLSRLLAPGLVGLSALLLVQYNLRSATRTVWYLAIMVLAMALLPRLALAGRARTPPWLGVSSPAPGPR